MSSAPTEREREIWGVRTIRASVGGNQGGKGNIFMRWCGAEGPSG